MSLYWMSFRMTCPILNHHQPHSTCLWQWYVQLGARLLRTCIVSSAPWGHTRWQKTPAVVFHVQRTSPRWRKAALIPRTVWVSKAIWWQSYNSLAAGRCGSDVQLAIFNVISRIDILSISFEIALRWMPHYLTGDLLTLVQVGAIRQQAITWAIVDPDLCCHIALHWPQSINSVRPSKCLSILHFFIQI